MRVLPTRLAVLGGCLLSTLALATEPALARTTSANETAVVHAASEGFSPFAWTLPAGTLEARTSLGVALADIPESETVGPFHSTSPINGLVLSAALTDHLQLTLTHRLAPSVALRFGDRDAPVQGAAPPGPRIVRILDPTGTQSGCLCRVPGRSPAGSALVAHRRIADWRPDRSGRIRSDVQQAQHDELRCEGWRGDRPAPAPPDAAGSGSALPGLVHFRVGASVAQPGARLRPRPGCPAPSPAAVAGAPPILVGRSRHHDLVARRHRTFIQTYQVGFTWSTP